jgi:uncharacterized repeat protein (TIGR01451 family)
MTLRELSFELFVPKRRISRMGRSLGLLARLAAGFGLLALSNANAANRVFHINGMLADGSAISGTVTIDTVTANSVNAIQSVNITIGAPSSQTCTAITYQGNAGASGYYVGLACTTGGKVFQITFNTPLSASGYLTGYTGGTINTSATNDSFFGTMSVNVQVASGSLTSILTPAFAKAFGAMTVNVGNSTSLTFTITNNDSASTLTGLAFTDTLPTGLVVSTPNALVNNCGGTVTATAASGSVSLTGGTLAASTACTITVNVTGTGLGMLTNTTSTLTSNASAAAAATANITVLALPPTFTKAFSAGPIFLGQTATLTFNVVNPNSVPLTGLAFTDPFPAGLLIATPSGAVNTCGGTLTATAGATSVSLAAGTVAASSSCAISVNVVPTVIGTLINTTSMLSSTQAASAAAATATVTVSFSADGPFQVSYAANLNLGESYIDIANTGANGSPLLGPGFGTQAGNLCVNVYAFDAGEELISCCSCLITPDETVNLGVNRDLTVKTLTGVVPTSVTVKLLSTLAGAGGSGTTCTNSAATVSGLSIVSGMAAWGTTIHSAAANGAIAMTETRYSPSTLSAGELASLAGRCAGILGNGSGFGLCNSCRAGALGASKNSQ